MDYWLMYTPQAFCIQVLLLADVTQCCYIRDSVGMPFPVNGYEEKKSNKKKLYFMTGKTDFVNVFKYLSRKLTKKQLNITE